MQTLNQVTYLRAAIRAEKAQDKRIALVPTMGNLHAGHLALIKRAHEIADVVIASIFVNPMQFGAGEDFDNYPRTLTEDLAKLEAENTHYLFTPDNKEIYPNGIEAHTKVNNAALGTNLEGHSRPTHFEGVCTVVSKLFNLVQPDMAIFGEKDYQQLAVIQRMTEDLCMPIDIVGVPTIRETNGLAMSSRNGYLTDTQRKQATAIYTELQSVKKQILSGNTSYNILCIEAKNELLAAGLEPDYFEICDAKTLTPIRENVDSDNIVVLAAAFAGKTRLLDNISLSINKR